MKPDRRRAGQAVAKRDPATPITRKPKQAVADLAWLPAPQGDIPTEFPDFMPEAHRVVGSAPSKMPVILAYALCALLVLALTWACVGRLSMFAIAPGETTAASGVQTVQPRASGQVSAIRVANGDRVKRGDVLLELDPTEAQANLAIIDGKLDDLRAEAARLRAELPAAAAVPVDASVAVTWPAGVSAGARDRQEKLLRTRLTQLGAVMAGLDASLAAKKVAKTNVAASIGSQQSLITARSERTNMHEQLADKGWDSRATVLQAMESLRKEQVALAVLQGTLGQAGAEVDVVATEIDKTRKVFLADDTAALAKAESGIDDLEQQRLKVRSDLADTVVRAPAPGVVEGLAVTSVRQSVRVGEQVLQVVADQVPVVVEAYVLNTDIGFVRVGQPVTVKVDSFPFTRYGTIKGRVTGVSVDAVAGKSALQQQKNDSLSAKAGPLSVTNAVQQTSDLVFPVRIALDRTTIDVNGTPVPLTPGMAVVAEIETERQRAINYFFFPLTRALTNRPGPSAAPG